MANAARYFSSRKWSYDAGFGETTIPQRHSDSPARHSAEFVTNQEIEACSACQLLPLHIAFLAYYHTVIGLGQRSGDGSCVTGAIDSQIINLDDVSLRKANCVPILLLVSCFWISVTTLWDMIIRLCMCKGRMGHLKVLDSKSSG